jgi:hypothetical protein
VKELGAERRAGFGLGQSCSRDMNTYGDATTPDMQAAHGKVTRLAISGAK